MRSLKFVTKTVQLVILAGAVVVVGSGAASASTVPAQQTVSAGVADGAFAGSCRVIDNRMRCTFIGVSRGASVRETVVTDPARVGTPAASAGDTFVASVVECGQDSSGSWCRLVAYQHADVPVGGYLPNTSGGRTLNIADATCPVSVSWQPSGLPQLWQGTSANPNGPDVFASAGIYAPATATGTVCGELLNGSWAGTADSAYGSTYPWSVVVATP